MALQWWNITPQNTTPQNTITQKNMPIGINATFSSIAVLNKDVLDLDNSAGPFLYVACCDSGQVILRRGIQNISSEQPLTDYIWGADDLSPSPASSFHCSFTALVANHHTHTLFLAYIERMTVSEGSDQCQRNVIKVWRKQKDKQWMDISPDPNLIDVDFLKITTDRNPKMDTLYIAYIDSNRNIFTQILNNASSCPFHPSVVPWITDPAVMHKAPRANNPVLANNVSISAINFNQYISFSNFSPLLLPFGSNPQVADDQRTTVMRKLLNSSSWDYYGFYVTASSAADTGFASAPDALSEGPTYYNSIAVEKEITTDPDRPDHNFGFVYLGFRGGLSEGGGGEFGSSYANVNNTNPNKPRWQGNPALGEITGSDIVSNYNGSANHITSAFDSADNVYFALSANPSAGGIKVFKYTASVLQPFIDITSAADGDLYLSLAFIDDNPLLTFVDLLGRVNVFVALDI